MQALEMWKAGAGLAHIAHRLGQNELAVAAVIEQARRAGDERAGRQAANRVGWSNNYSDNDEQLISLAAGKAVAQRMEKASQTGAHIPLMDLAAGQCRWPTLLGADGEQLFCGHTVQTPDWVHVSVNYCAIHTRYAAKPARPFTGAFVDYVASCGRVKQ